MAATANMICPACQTFQPRAEGCANCGVIIAKRKNPTYALGTQPVASSENKKAPAGFYVIALLVIIPVIGFFLFSGDESADRSVSNNVATATPVTTDSNKKKMSAAGLANKLKRDKVISKLQQLKTSLHMFGVDGAEPPSNEEGLQSLVDKGFLQPQDIIDEWGNEYVYRLEWGKDDGFWKEYKIFVHSNGPDGISGNKDDIRMH